MIFFISQRKSFLTVFLSDENVPVTSTEQYFASPSSGQSGNVSRNFPAPVTNLATPTFPVTSQKIDSNIMFYDVNPKDSQSVLLPPLLPPAGNPPVIPNISMSPQSQYSAPQQKLVF